MCRSGTPLFQDPLMPRPSRSHAIARLWKDGDTMLLFGVLAVVCCTLILWRALDPGNWQVLADEIPAASQVGVVCPPSTTP